MTWAKWIFAYLFDCVHRHTTWPQRARTGLDYVCCLDCGKEFAYSTQLMCTVSKEEQLKDRGQCRWNHDSEFNEEKEMKLSQMYRTALIATTMLILSSGLDMGGFA